MKQNNIWMKSLTAALLNTIGLVVAIFIMYKLTDRPQPNLLLWGIAGFVGFFLLRLLAHKSREDK